MFDQYTYLYVEDDPMSRQIVCTLMKNVLGITAITIFEDSENFMERLRTLPQKPDVILLDIHLSPYSGFELLAQIRDDHAYDQSRVIAITASVMNEEFKKLRSSGFDGAIGKPLNMENFPTIMQMILANEAVWYV
jgi:CheY-like chemotaxis protein